MRVFIKRSFLRACWLSGLFRLSRILTRRKLNILCYHGFRVEDEGDFRPGLFMSRDTFARRLSFIRAQKFSVLPLDEAVRRLYAGTLPKSTVAITIDDGFHSVGRVAAEILRLYGFPATLYLTTYYVQKGTPIFRLVVQYMFWKTQESILDCTDFNWLNDTIVDMGNSQDRERVMWALIEYAERYCSEGERLSIAQTLGDKLGVGFKHIADSRILSLMTPEDIKRFDQVFDVQLHSHRHRFPSKDEMRAFKEIQDNREAIRSMLGYTAKHFCYPSGIWARHQWSWLEKMGVSSATTCMPGFNSIRTPPLALMRFLDSEEISEIEFMAEMQGFSELLRIVHRAAKNVESAVSQKFCRC